MRNPKKNSGCENHCFNPLEPIKNSCCAIWIGRMHSTGGHVRGFNPEQWSFEFCTTTISILLYVYIQYIHIYIYIIFRIVIIIIIIVIIIIIIVVVVVLLLYYCGYYYYDNHVCEWPKWQLRLRLLGSCVTWRDAIGCLDSRGYWLGFLYILYTYR